MTLDERARHDMFLRLEEVLGPDTAGTLMEHLPPIGWADVATKRDLDHHAAIAKRDLEAVESSLRHDLAAVESSLRHDLAAVESSLRHDLAAVESSLRHDFEGLRRDFKTLESSVRHDIEGLEERMDLRFEAMRHEFTGTLAEKIAAQTRTVAFTVLGSVLGSTGLALAATRIAA